MIQLCTIWISYPKTGVCSQILWLRKQPVFIVYKMRQKNTSIRISGSKTRQITGKLTPYNTPHPKNRKHKPIKILASAGLFADKENDMANIEVPAEYKMSEHGIAFLKNAEGFRSKPYIDDAGHWTIGYGHTAKAGGINPATFKKELTKADAEKMLREDLKQYENAVMRLVKVPLTTNQRDALISFVFNEGAEKFQTSTLLEELNKGNYNAVPKQLMRWKYAKNNGKTFESKGLRTRRKREANIWFKNDYLHADWDPESSSSNNLAPETKNNKNATTTNQSTLNGQTQSSVNAQRQPPSDNQFHVPETVPQKPLQNGQNIQPPIGTPLNNTRSHGSDWPQNFDGAPSDPRGPFRVPQYPPNPNSSTPNNWPQPVRKKTSLFGSLGNIFKRNPTEVQQLGPTQLSPNQQPSQQQWNNSTESQQTDFRQLPLNQQPSTQHENIFKRIFNFLRFNIFHGGSR